MKINIYCLLCACLCISTGAAQAQDRTLIAKEQIEDAYVLNTGDVVTGDLTAATSVVSASVVNITSGAGEFKLLQDGSLAAIRSSVNLYLDPTNNGAAGGVIVPTTLMEFPDDLGDKIRFYSHSYSIGLSPFDLDITSDRNIKFHSDTSEDMMVISGDEGDVSVKRDLTTGRDVIAGNVFKFSEDSVGDKLLLYDTLYRLNISASTYNTYSDQFFKWHSDEYSDAMTLDADTGTLSLTGPLQLPVYTSLPSGSTGALIYFDHPSDDLQDGAYIYNATSWLKL